MDLKHCEIILYVSDQEVSTAFYEFMFKRKADLNVPGMTEFILTDNLKLGLMPNKGISKILGENCPDPESGTGIPRCELYFLVENLEEEFQHLSVKARLVSPVSKRSWGDAVCYFSDPDGHIIALASKGNRN